MLKISRLPLCFSGIFLLTPYQTHAYMYVDDGKITYFCNAKTSRFYFDTEKTPNSPLLKKYIVPIWPLLITSREDEAGNIKRLGSKKAIRHCGDMTLVFKSGFSNSNIQGELGTLDYPLISLSIKNKNIINDAPLALCYDGGYCPTDFSIQSIHAVKTSNGNYKVDIVKQMPNLSSPQEQKIQAESLNIKTGR